MARVAALAADTTRPGALRVEAVAVLGVWPDPSPMDRVDGIHFGPDKKERDRKAASAAVHRLIEALPAPTSGGEQSGAAMRAALADAAGNLEVKAVAPVLLDQLRRDPAREVRLASLRALQAMKVGNMDEVMRIAFADKEAAIRRAALGILPELPMTDVAKAQHLASVIKTGSIEEKQGALQVLGTLKSQEAQRLLGTYLDDLTAGRTAPELQIDLVEAVQSSGSAALEARLEALQKARGADNVMAAFRDALLRGGDPRRGQQVAAEHPAAECTRCHSIYGRGADVGPNLSKIGATLTREQLLQSLLEPNARIAPGFGTVSIKLKNGQQVDGTLREETDTHVVVLAGTPPVEQRVAKAEIAARTDPVSAMPPMGLLLKPREVRDLVEFLSALK